MRKMLFVPVGGLANRMRAVVSAYTLMQQVEGNLKVLWFRDWALNAPFYELFESFDGKGYILKEADRTDLLIYDRPRKKNFYVPALFQKLLFRVRVYEHEVYPFCTRESYWMNLALKDNVYMASCYQFMNYDNELLRSMFRPIASIRKEIEQRCGRFTGYTIGLHIRRTDNVVSIRQSPLELFYALIDEEKARHSDLCIYLATDSEEVKENLRDRYGERLIVTDSVADRGSVQGIRDAIADMYTLSHTSKIYGSSGSSFSELAAQLGDVPLQIVCK